MIQDCIAQLQSPGGQMGEVKITVTCDAVTDPLREFYVEEIRRLIHEASQPKHYRETDARERDAALGFSDN